MRKIFSLATRPLTFIFIFTFFMLQPFTPVAPAAPAALDALEPPELPELPELPIVSNSKVDHQPLSAQVKRLIEALELLGSPIPDIDKNALQTATTVEETQKVMDKHPLFLVNINPEQRVKVAPGPCEPILEENGWRSFLVKVINEAGTTAELKVESPNASPVYKRSSGSPNPQESLKKEEVAGRWLDIAMFNQQPLRKELSGLLVEYRIVQLYCGDRSLGSTFSDRDGTPPVKGSGSFKREAKISFNVGQGTQDLGFRNDCDLLFSCKPSVDVKLRVLDDNGEPTTGLLLIRDDRGRVYPSQAKRLAPDFFFHPQIYRHDGEVLKLPPGYYNVEYRRGPEYVAKKVRLEVPSHDSHEIEATFKLQRWVDPAKFGWVSGDHHIHAAGCAHYENPTQGVFPEDMWRHVLGEDLKVGCVLTWGPCYYYQKQFFTGKPDKLSTDKYLMRYDIEVSGWSSHRSGHLCLLRLNDQDYPGTKVQEDWPNLGLSVLKWAKSQGAVAGSAHSGWGLEVPGDELPNYNIPPFNGIGANEYIMQVAHKVSDPAGKLVPAIDFISTVDTPYVWELNIWYHTLNAGFRTRISGETDFPCIYGERVGLGRVYVKLDDTSKLDFDQWADGIVAGRSYVSDGKSHIIDFKLNDLEVGTMNSELKLTTPATIVATAKVAALLDEKPHPEVKSKPYQQKPYWDLERARIETTRQVPVELVVNGYPVAVKNIVADGTLQEVKFDSIKIEVSSWVTMRILPSSHTNPIFVIVDNKPIRASKRSVEWCLKSLGVCWEQKSKTYKIEELETATAAYEYAREVYRQILAETEAE